MKKVETITFNNLKININQNDCMHFLRSLEPKTIDLIITDPAYSGMNNKLKLGKGRIVGEYKNKGENGKWFAEFEDNIENYRSFLSECRRVLNDTGHIYIMFDSFSLLSLGNLVREYFDVKNIITWDKVNMGMGHYYRRRHEFILFATNGNNRKIKTRAMPDVWRIKRIHNSKYPTQKPVEVFSNMLYSSALPGMNICDPFMGSGSSAIAAIINNCNFVGCDISPSAFDLTNKRVNFFIKNGTDLLQKNISSDIIQPMLFTELKWQI